MCGIFGIFGNPTYYTREQIIELSKKVQHRGPDWSGIYLDNIAALCHERLSIVGVDNGSQPIISSDGDIILSVNGEIYNYKKLEKSLNNKYKHVTSSDCEIILNLYKEYGENFSNYLDGIFGFALYDKQKQLLLISRDPIGVIPLYYGRDKYGSIFVASEQKCLKDCEEVFHVKPGTNMVFKLNSIYKPIIDKIYNYYNPHWHNNNYRIIENEEQICEKIRTTLTNSVDKRLMAEVPFGVLLSGGLDSSLIASITKKLLKNKNTNFGNKLHSFAIGLTGAPDLKAARIAADYLETIHHEFTFTVQEGLDSIRDLIYKLETYDITTIRASTPMYLLARKIKSIGIKMVLSGEGADEILGGYLYFHKAPNNDEFHNECKRRVSDLHNFDCLRANKSTMAWGLETRVPFLDKEFLELAMMINPGQKCSNNIEKYILRKAFDTPENRYLPNEILWRQKEQFSDGVGYSWIDKVKEHCESCISNEEYEQLKSIYSDIPTKEAAYFRKIYEELFPNRESLVKRWIPKQTWEGVSYDPSGRAQKIHVNTTQ